MLTLASMIWAAYTFIAEYLPNRVPMPVIIETGEVYKYNEIDNAIYVPLHWTDSCENQQKVIKLMGEHYNNFRSPHIKFSDDKLNRIAKKWICIQ